MSNFRVARFGDRNRAEVALTFDDGPNPHFTPAILDTLDRFHVKATFFVIGTRCLEYPDLLRQIMSRGHIIGNHSASHGGGDFRICDETITNITGLTAKYVRPPFYNLSYCAQEVDFLKNKKIVTGDVDSRDYLLISEDEVVDNVLSNTQNGSIIDLHDGSEDDSDLLIRAQKTLHALPRVITQLAKRYSLVSIDAMHLQFIDHIDTSQS